MTDRSPVDRRPLSGLGRRLVANAIGTGAAMLFAIGFLPIYLRALGPEAYGLVGLFTVLFTLLVVLDLGLSTLLNRELSRAAVGALDPLEARTLTRTTETIYWAIAIAIGAALLLLADPIAHRWVRLEQLPVEVAVRAVRLMGLVALLQWPQLVYTGALIGLERQVRFNVIKVSMAAIRGGGAVWILLRISPTIEAFFLWQLVTAVLHTGWLAIAVHGALPRVEGRPRFDLHTLRRHWRFAASITVITAAMTLLAQIDKVVLSRMLPLEEFGYYSFAATAAGAIHLLSRPFSQAFFPRLSRLHAIGDPPALRQTYHTGCQWIAVAVFPLAAVLVVFAPTVLHVWTGNAALVRRATGVFRWLVAGAALQSFLVLPYILQVAAGWTRLAMIKYPAGLAVALSLLPVVIARHGALGAAALWFFLHAAYVVLEPPLMHTRLLPGAARRWYLVDLASPVLGSLLAALGLHALLPPPTARLAGLAVLGLVYALALGAALLLTPIPRSTIAATLRRLRAAASARGYHRG